MGLPDFSDLPEMFSEGESFVVPYARHKGVTFTSGLPTDSGWDQAELEASSVFPAQPRELEGLEEGQRERGAIWVYTATKPQGISAPGAATTIKADIFQWRDALWQVTQVGDYSAGGFYEVLAVRMDRPETTVAAYVAAEAA